MIEDLYHASLCTTKTSGFEVCVTLERCMPACIKLQQYFEHFAIAGTFAASMHALLHNISAHQCWCMHAVRQEQDGQQQTFDAGKH